MSDNSASYFKNADQQPFSNPIPPNVLNGILNSSINVCELLKVIFKKVHPLFNIDCGLVVIYDEQLTIVREAFISTFLADTGQFYTEIIDQPSELSKVQKAIAEFTYPVLKTEAEWIVDEKTNHSLVNKADNYKYHGYIPLEIHNKIFGTLELHNNAKELSTECLMFCSSIADILAEIIYIQHTKSTSQGKPHNVLTPPQQGPANTGVHTLNDADLVRLMNGNQPASDQSKSNPLKELVKRAALLNPAVYSKIKDELDDISTFKQMLEEKANQTRINDSNSEYPEIIGAGLKMRKVFSMMNQVADSDSTVLIWGETGTGKELIARALHNSSTRREKAMVKVNCAAIPANLIESELFGHEKGAFTGAMDRRIGKFELADNGTIFLDEIGELPLDLQVKLLRVLQEKEFERVGGKSVISVNVRIISATNKDLLKEVEQGRFRRDLYYRLNVFPINLPPLRERPEDIPLLASYFLSKYTKRPTVLSHRAVTQMKNYDWPGNVREMEHLIERQVLLTTQPVISEINLPVKAKTLTDKKGMVHAIKTIDENERDHVLAVLQFCKGRISGPEGAAKLLGVPATTLNSKIKRLGLNKRHF
jgi:transcriptional regulator with GAF, ATPase, and Fis domain